MHAEATGPEKERGAQRSKARSARDAGGGRWASERRSARERNAGAPPIEPLHAHRFAQSSSLDSSWPSKQILHTGFAAAGGMAIAVLHASHVAFFEASAFSFS